MNILKQFQSGLKKTSNFLTTNIVGALQSKKVDRETLNKIEEILLSSDIGLEVTEQLIKKIVYLIISTMTSSALFFIDL